MDDRRRHHAEERTMPEDLRPTAAIATQEASTMGGLVPVRLWTDYDKLIVAGVSVALTPAERDALRARFLRLAKGGR
jgi:hypothetical protein